MEHALQAGPGPRDVRIILVESLEVRAPRGCARGHKGARVRDHAWQRNRDIEPRARNYTMLSVVLKAGKVSVSDAVFGTKSVWSEKMSWYTI